MRWTLLAITLVLALQAGQGYPLYGDNGAVKCIVFDAFENALPSGYESGNNVSLYVDAAISGTSGAAFRMVDDEDNVYLLEENLSRGLQPGRMTLSFVMPRETVLKGMVVEPVEGEPFNVDWEEIKRYTNGIVNLRYYGIVNWMIDPELQAVTLDLRLANNGTVPLTLSPADFTLVDQWGWRYFCNETFQAFELQPRTFVRMGITFLDMSPRSRPVSLEYGYETESPIVVYIDTYPAASAAGSAESAGGDTTSVAVPPTTTPGAATKSSVAPAQETTLEVQPGGMDQQTLERMERLKDQLRGKL